MLKLPIFWWYVFAFFIEMAFIAPTYQYYNVINYNGDPEIFSNRVLLYTACFCGIIAILNAFTFYRALKRGWPILSSKHYFNLILSVLMTAVKYWFIPGSMLILIIFFYLLFKIKGISSSN
jgi:hypothetical protein